MRNCVRRFAESMDAMLDEKEEEYGKVERAIQIYWTDELIELIGHRVEKLMDMDPVTEMDEILRNIIHTANYGMMAWAKNKGYGI